MNRRQLLTAGAVALTGLCSPRKGATEHARNRKGRGTIPLIHTTDLYHPPQDPDDHFDLATIASLEEFDLKGVILDPTSQYLNPSSDSSDIHRDPGFAPVSQMAYLLRRDIPVAAGPQDPLKHAHDDISDRPREDQAGVELLIKLLEQSVTKVNISAVGSCRVLTAAFNRNPGLLRAKTESVLLNAGSTGGTKREWNVRLDPEAYKGLWQSGLPIRWYPCATDKGAFDQDHERGTHWRTSHETLLQGVSTSLRAWFAYALAASDRKDIIGVLSEAPPQPAWSAFLAQTRNLWSTASLVMAAGRVLARTAMGWRFVANATPIMEGVWPWRLDAVDATVNDRAEVTWRNVEGNGNALLFGRKQGKEFGDAMAEALNALLKSFPG